MKTLFTLLIVLMLSNLDAFTQTIRVQTGFSYTSMKYKWMDNYRSDHFVFNPGFQLGTMVDFPLNSSISLSTGALVQTKGFRETGEWQINEKFVWRYDLWYLDLPILLNGKIKVGKVDLFAGIGPYVGIGLSAKEFYKEIFGNDVKVETMKMKFGSSENDHLKRFEYGVMARIGTEINLVKIGFSYALSLTDITIHENNRKLKNKELTLFISYPIFRKV